ncbi:MAG: beta-N-acetylhexosaminidase, partial [Planctomycetota bacterium]
MRGWMLCVSLMGMPVVPCSVFGAPADASRPRPPAGSLALVPRPAEVTAQAGHFILRPDTLIVVDAATADTGRYLAELLAPATAYRLGRKTVSKPEPRANCLVLVSSPEKKELGEEGYELVVAKAHVIIRAPKPAGVFYGVQTLRQLLPPRIESDKPAASGATWPIPCVRIKDKPLYPRRGVLLDPARQFLSVDFLKRYIDLLAFHKMNWLHLHLTDNQAWPVTIRKYPQLTEIKRWPGAAQDPKWDHGIYSQDDIRALVAYAARRHVTIVPEFEMPAHFSVIAGVLPELLCPNNPLRSLDKQSWEPLKSHQWAHPCPGSEKTFEILEGILAEIMELFPSAYIHLGGDEWTGLPWKQCPRCKERIEREGFGKAEPGSPDHQLVYRYFMRRMCRYVVSKGRKPTFWYDRVWEGYPFPDGSVVHMWHEWGGKPHVKAAKVGHEVLSSSVPVLYFDLGNPLAVEPVYRFDPMPKAMSGSDLSARLIGMSAPLWNQKQDEVDPRAFPRGSAMAETAWTPRDRQDWKDFSQRLPRHLARLEIMKVAYAGGPRPGVWTVGHWSPTQMKPKEQRITLGWDITQAIQRPGKYRAELIYTKGMDGVYIEWVALREDGRE